MFDQSSGLKRFIEDEKGRYPFPWFDNRGNNLTVPSISVSEQYLLIANMTNPYSLGGGQSYADPQRLHRQTILKLTEETNNEAIKYETTPFKYHEHMWDLRRLGLICDYNGINLHALHLGDNYSEPGSPRRYHLNRTGGTPFQLAGYQQRLESIAAFIK